MSSSQHEAAILGDFLVAPAALRNIVTLEEFAVFFPRSDREKPAVRALYRELQRLRQEQVERVRDAITDEVKKSRPLKREVVENLRRSDHMAVAGLDPVALEMEAELSGHGQRKKPHTLESIHPAIEEACQTIEAQIEEMDDEMARALSEVRDAVEELSDLRYGTFPKAVGGGNISEEVVATLKRLEAVCEDPAG